MKNTSSEQLILAEIKKINARNRKVEADKAWETSSTRVILISAVTYAIASIVMYLIGVTNYLLNALIPTIGYFLSTQSLPHIKRWWIGRYLRARK